MLETAGIPTLCLSSALSITQAVNPPRAVFIDFPLGHTSGKPFAPDEQDALLTRALRRFETSATPGEILLFDDCWGADDAWKIAVLDAHADDRSERAPLPQYQTPQDAQLASAALAHGGCPTCVWVDET